MIYILKNIGKGKIGAGHRQIKPVDLFRMSIPGPEGPEGPAGEVIFAGESGRMYDSLAAAQAVDPKPADGTVFQVSKLDTSNAGVYTFQSSEIGGIRFEKKFPKEQDPVEYYHFDGAAEFQLGEDYILDAVGDYVEFVGRYNSTDYFQGLSLMGKYGFSNTIGYYTNREFRLRGSDATYHIWNTRELSGEFVTIKIQVVSEGWLLEINGISQGVKPKTSSVTINNIGNAYSSDGKANADFKYFKIHTSTKEREVVDFTSEGSVNVKSVLNNDLNNDFSDCYLSWNGLNQFNVFVKLNAAFYIGYNITHIVDPEIRADLWRIAGANMYHLRNGQQVRLSTVLLTGAESESVFIQAGKTDYTGGFHGDEILTDVKFLLDGVPLTPEEMAVSFSLKPANEFSYIMKSQLLETDNAVETLLAIHHKHTFLKNSGYYTFNRIIFQMPITVGTSYLSGLTCISHDVADQAFNENFDYYTFTHSAPSDPDQGTGNEITYYSNTNKLGAVVNSKILKPEAYDKEARIKFSDSGVYSKYYRYVTNKDVIEGEVWEGEMTVKFFKQ